MKQKSKKQLNKEINSVFFMGDLYLEIPPKTKWNKRIKILHDKKQWTIDL
jgi:hypothetical protein